MEKCFAIQNYEIFDESFKNLLKEHSIEEIAEKIDAHITTVTNWYNKIRHPNSEYLKKLIMAYNLNIEEYGIIEIFDNTFGKRLKKSLKSKKISQSQLAEYLSLEPSTISNWINDKYTPNSLDILKKISEYVDNRDDYNYLNTVIHKIKVNLEKVNAIIRLQE